MLCATAYRPRGETPLVFGIFDQQGLMASLSIDGTKISRIKR
jgi:lipid-binding SYLF domain-containing protein